MNRRIKIYSLLCILMFSVACANRGIGPQGGPKDTTPPKVVKEEPENGALNYKGKTIEISFDEYIQLDKVSENVLISPPQQRPPEVKAIGKKVKVTFDGEMKDSTTYTIDFGSAICDNNEKNALENYSFSFSTGDVIDSLRIGGIMLNAEDLNPVSGIVVGIHSNMDDSAFTTIPFDRISKTNSEGEFWIKNIHPGTYKLFGLQDFSQDYLFQPGEGLSMYDSLITPVCHREVIQDTLWKDSISSRMVEGLKVRDTIEVIDTIMEVETTFFQPDSIVLIFFKEDKQRHYFIRALREEQHLITLLFSAPQDTLPEITPLDTMWTEAALKEVSKNGDTIRYWLTDSAYMNIDTLRFEMNYQVSDSVYNLEWKLDTVRAVYRAPKLTDKAKAALERKKKEEKIEIKTNASNQFEIYNPLLIKLSKPIARLNVDSIGLYKVVDTVLTPILVTIEKLDSVGLTYSINYDWKAEQTYELQIDSAAIQDIYGKVNDKFKARFKIRSLDEYSSLIIKVNPFNPQARIQVLDEKDAVVKEMQATENGTKFEYLAPKSYYVRMYIDNNDDQKWTTGNYDLRRQPEPVYYFPNKLTLRANWDFEETIDYLATPIQKQKPQEIRKDIGKKK